MPIEQTGRSLQLKNEIEIRVLIQDTDIVEEIIGKVLMLPDGSFVEGVPSQNECRAYKTRPGLGPVAKPEARIMCMHCELHCQGKKEIGCPGRPAVMQRIGLTPTGGMRPGPNTTQLTIHGTRPSGANTTARGLTRTRTAAFVVGLSLLGLPGYGASVDRSQASADAGKSSFRLLGQLPVQNPGIYGRVRALPGRPGFAQGAVPYTAFRTLPRRGLRR